MIKFFRNLPAGQAGKVINYLKYAIGEIFLGAELRRGSPFRDLIWVEQTISQAPTVPLGTGYVGNPKLGTNHIAYLPTGQADLRHAIPDYKSVFYRYFVPRNDRDLRPTGQ